MTTAVAQQDVAREDRRTYRVGHFRVRLVRDSSVSSDVKVIRSAADAAGIVRAMLDGVDRETFVVVLLNTRHAVIAVNTVSVGGLAAAPVHPREVFKPAVIAGAAAVIIGHNHPSGDATPSRDDIVITEQLRSAGRLLGIEVLDHVIIGDGTTKYVSLRERGWN